jgi:dinuclear metal center YbgI/SA1388 family protein
MTLRDLAARVEAMAPSALAESWDNVGLQIGDPGAPVRRAMTCLEATTPIFEEAQRRRADVLIAHHPLIFRPMKTLRADRPAERLAVEVAALGLGLIVAHTNLDAAPWGTNHALAEACGLRDVEPLQPAAPEPIYKLVVFTPEGCVQAVIDAIDRGGGGRIGDYTHCTFRAPGTGTFLGGEGTDPFIGKAGRLEEAGELRIEAIVPESARDRVEDELLEVHPYEEPAFDWIPLRAEPTAGLGLVAELKRAESPAAIARSIKRRLKLEWMRVSGPTRTPIERLAICTGSGGSLLGAAQSAGAGALLTGEANYHAAVEAHHRGMALIEIGHFESERIVVKPWAKKLAADAEIAKAGVEIIAAEDDLQPYRMV